MKIKNTIILYKGMIMIIVFMIVIMLFTALCLYLLIYNNFSSDLNEMLVKLIGAIIISTYFIINTFLLNPTEPYIFQVSTPVAKAVDLPVFTSPYRPETTAAVEVTNMFLGIKLFWEELTRPGNQYQKILFERGNSDVLSLELTELIFFQWLERESNWLAIDKFMSYGHGGYSGGVSMDKPTKSNSKKIDMGTIENSNPFIKMSDNRVVTLPKGATIERKILPFRIENKITTDMGTIWISFTGGGGTLIQKGINTVSDNIIKRIDPKEGVNLYMMYPEIKVRHNLNSIGQFSKQSKKERAWIKKMEVKVYKDFSWDLYREYLGRGSYPALDLFRSKYGDPI